MHQILHSENHIFKHLRSFISSFKAWSLVLVTTFLVSGLLKTHRGTHKNDFCGISDNSGSKEQMSYRFCYKGNCKTGKPFSVTHQVSKIIKQLHQTSLPKVSKHEQPVFVTGASANHYFETLDAIASIQCYFPQSTILYYDWGLKENQRNKVKSWCQVKVVDLDDCSNRTGNKEEFYEMKILAIVQSLLQHPCVFWIDSSVRFLHGNLASTQQVALYNGGVACFLNIGGTHSTYAATHPSMFEYLPSMTNLLQLPGHHQSGAMLFYRTESTIANIIQWWFLCALHSECISPIQWSRCDFTHGRMKVYADCHRFDQSAVNILLANANQFMTKMYSVDEPIIVIRRGYTKYFNISVC